jgi:hypothetical protein
MSRPSSSSVSVTRRPITALRMKRMTAVTTPVHTMVNSTPWVWTHICAPMLLLPSVPTVPNPPSAGAAKRPVRMAPMMPPTPWTPKASSESS